MDNLNDKFIWTSELSVGDEAIDVQHQTLLFNVNKLRLVSDDAQALDTLMSVVKFLGEYIADHFSYEEDYMQAHNYPEYEHHRAIHQKFIDKYNEFNAKIKDDGSSEELLQEVRDFIGNWFLEHIAVEDQKYEEYISNLKS